MLGVLNLGDKLAEDILAALSRDDKIHSQLELAHCRRNKKGFIYQNLQYVHKLLSLAILQFLHDATPAGHSGIEPTYTLLFRCYSWLNCH